MVFSYSIFEILRKQLLNFNIYITGTFRLRDKTKDLQVVVKQYMAILQILETWRDQQSQKIVILI